MYQCELCNFESLSLKAYAHHFTFHRSLANYQYPCGVTWCKRKFQTYESFKSHIYRDHSIHGKSCAIHASQCTEVRHHEVNTLSCRVPRCSCTFKSLHNLLAHLRTHIDSKVEIECPFIDCQTRHIKFVTLEICLQHNNLEVEIVINLSNKPPRNCILENLWQEKFPFYL